MISGKVRLTHDGRQLISAGGNAYDPPADSWLPDGDYDIHVWQLPESVWPREQAADHEPNPIGVIPRSNRLEGQADIIEDRLISPTDLKEIRRFPGHTGHVGSVSFSNDGRWCLSGSLDRSVRLWEVSTGVPVQTLRISRGQVWATAISPDKTTVACGDAHGTLYLFDVNSGEKTAEWTGHNSGVNGLLYTPNGEWLVSLGRQDTVCVWNPSTQVKLHETRHGNVGGHALALGARGQALLYTDQHDLVLWDPSSNEDRLRVFAGGSDNVAASPDGKWIAKNGGSTIEIRQASNGAIQNVLYGHSSGPRFVFSPDSRFLFSVAWDNTFRIWSMESMTEIGRIDTGNTIPGAIAVSPDGRHVITSGGARRSPDVEGWIPGSDYDLRLWQLPQCVWPQKPADPEDATEENGTRLRSSS